MAGNGFDTNSPIRFKPSDLVMHLPNLLNKRIECGGAPEFSALLDGVEHDDIGRPAIGAGASANTDKLSALTTKECS